MERNVSIHHAELVYLNARSYRSFALKKVQQGEGSRIRISSVNASSEGTSVYVTWRYEGIGWKTDELQAKLWTESSGQENPKTLTYSTLNEQVFSIRDLEPGTMYSVLLRPAPNIRSEEITYQFIISALLMPIQMSAYVIWSGSLKLLWDAAKTYSETGDVREPSNYSISYQMETPNAETKEFFVESGQEFQLTPLTIQMKYTFRLGCFFADKFHPCGMVSVRTGAQGPVLSSGPRPQAVLRRPWTQNGGHHCQFVGSSPDATENLSCIYGDAN
ncbi:c-type lectin domain-containing protein [Trichonephila clavipes]|nr:c-type lectin domain-containing protein [Trichonephila clavipes]